MHVCFDFLTLARKSTLCSILFICLSSSAVNLFSKGSNWPVCSHNTSNQSAFAFFMINTQMISVTDRAEVGWAGWVWKQHDCLSALKLKCCHPCRKLQSTKFQKNVMSYLTRANCLLEGRRYDIAPASCYSCGKISISCANEASINLFPQ